MAILFLEILAGYIAVGALFALAFVGVGVSKVDPTAHGAPVGFRLLILPGSAALWPWFLMKWMRARK